MDAKFMIKQMVKELALKWLKFIIALSFLFLAACAKPDGSPGAAVGGQLPPTTTLPGAGNVDNSPHIYEIAVDPLSPGGANFTATVRQVCNLNFPSQPGGTRDETISPVLQAPNTRAGVGCADAKDYTATITNTGTQTIYVVIYFDGTYSPELIKELTGRNDEALLPGQSVTFQRGF